MHSLLSAVDDVLARLDHEDRRRVQPCFAGADAIAAMPQSILVTALRNGLDNALRHSGENTPVILQADLGGGQCAGTAVEVTDSRPGNCRGAPGRHPAARARRDGARRTHRAGPGLSIVQGSCPAMAALRGLSQPDCRSRPTGSSPAVALMPRSRLQPPWNWRHLNVPSHAPGAWANTAGNRGRYYPAGRCGWRQTSQV